MVYTVTTSTDMEDIVNNFDTDARFQSYMTILFENLKQVMYSWNN